MGGDGVGPECDKSLRNVMNRERTSHTLVL
jgi:hypothetical protein